MAYCGSTSVLTGDFGSVEGFNFSMDLGSNEIDVRAFGSGEWGDTIACGLNGTIVLDSYLRPDVDIGDKVSWAADICTEKWAVDGVVTNQSINVDAKDVVTFSTTIRMTGDAVITPIP